MQILTDDHRAKIAIFRAVIRGQGKVVWIILVAYAVFFAALVLFDLSTRTILNWLMTYFVFHCGYLLYCRLDYRLSGLFGAVGGVAALVGLNLTPWGFLVAVVSFGLFVLFEPKRKKVKNG